MNTPNKLTLLRMILVPIMVITYYLADSFSYFYIITTIIFILAAVTDFLDGYLARKNNQITDFGKFMDPLADKALVLVALILIVDKGLLSTLSSESINLIFEIIPPISLIIMLIRELVVSGLRLIGANKGIVIAADKLGKAKTVTQDIAIPMLLIYPYFIDFANISNFFLISGESILLISAIVSVISGASYIIKNKNLFKEAK